MDFDLETNEALKKTVTVTHKKVKTFDNIPGNGQETGKKNNDDTVNIGPEAEGQPATGN